MDPGYGKDLNVKLGNLSKCQQSVSESSTANQGQNQRYIRGENLINLITQVRR